MDTQRADAVEKWRVKYDTNFVVQNIELPEARSGTTALLFLLAGHSEVSRVFFQPQKTLMRFGGPRVILDGNDSLVFFSLAEVNELEDPIGTLLKAGVPADKDYFRKHIGISLDRKEYRYSPNSYSIDPALAREVSALC
jgi:hypothetical protein